MTLTPFQVLNSYLWLLALYCVVQHRYRSCSSTQKILLDNPSPSDSEELSQLTLIGNIFSNWHDCACVNNSFLKTERVPNKTDGKRV